MIERLARKHANNAGNKGNSRAYKKNTTRFIEERQVEKNTPQAADFFFVGFL
jgi:hypothetical protein